MFNSTDSSFKSINIFQESLLTIQSAARYSGYNLQYLRRLLRNGKLDGVKIGQVESFFNDSPLVTLPSYDVTSMEDVEKAAHRLRMDWELEFDPIENMMELFEDRGIKVGLVKEFELLKHKYGLSMQAWIYRAKDLGIISSALAERYFKRFRQNRWNRNEPGKAYLPEKPQRMERLIYRALAEDIISFSKVKEY
jgi:hypothetical protein